MNAPFYKSLPTKTRVYESLYALHRGFEITLLSFEQMEHLEMFRGEHLNVFKVSLERTRAEANRCGLMVRRALLFRLRHL